MNLAPRIDPNAVDHVAEPTWPEAVMAKLDSLRREADDARALFQSSLLQIELVEDRIVKLRNSGATMDAVQASILQREDCQERAADRRRDWEVK
jgi:hypothetical protein